MINKEGWLIKAEKHISPNFDQRPKNTDIKLIVIHNISLPPENFEPENVKKFFMNKLDFDTHKFFQEIEMILARYLRFQIFFQFEFLVY